MTLAQLLAGIVAVKDDVYISGLTLDSRHVQSGDVFIALHGERQHGLEFVDQAVINGAIAVVYEPDGVAVLPEAIISVAVPGLADKLGEIAARFYQRPATQLAVIGITGTNGKTTCSQLIAQALPDCGVIGTLGWGEPGNLLPTLNTTPDALAIQAMLHQLVRAGKRTVAMEVSSHGLQQGRVNAVTFAGAVFTNFSRDHLDYHRSMDEYLKAKLALFTSPDLRFTVINLDDPKSSEVLQVLSESVSRWTFSTQGRVLAGANSLCADNVDYRQDGIAFAVTWNRQTLAAVTPLVGKFNLENVLAVLAVMLASGIDFEHAVAQLAKLQPIAGRMQRFGGNGKPTVIVDYAHSPDALEKLLNAVRGSQHLCVVFGCGGNRDSGKRAEMGRIAEALADRVIVTDDNPRYESPAAIIDDILTGCQSKQIQVINDRAMAIQTAIQQAAANDWIVIAGKGHENYQDINGVKWPFSDQAQVQQALAAWRQ